MVKNPSQALFPAGVVEHRIYLLRTHKVMLDHDLAHLYGVDTRILNQAVKRNRERFPEDFMFQLSSKETKNLRSQIVTSRWGGRRYLPYAFTEQGVAMLSSVLKSKRAIQVKYRHHAHLCAAAADPCHPQGVGTEAGRARAEIRCPVQRGL